uniref:Putative kazal type serine protease inhibitor n=1 Tax=Culex tarsalis TaxID=7177 RepID=A0A1Q3FTB0_CULTA
MATHQLPTASLATLLLLLISPNCTTCRRLAERDVSDQLSRMYRLLEMLSLQSERTIRETVCIVPVLEQPVCGSDGQTYGNRQLLECTALARKDRKRNLLVSRMGIC